MEKNNFDEIIVNEVLIQMDKYGITDWEFEVVFSPGGSSKITGHYSIGLTKYQGVPTFNNTKLKKWYQTVLPDPKLHFNKIIFNVNSNGVCNTRYLWDNGELKSHATQSANVTPQWINSQILRLLNEAGYPDEESYWQRGVFTFTVVKTEIVSNIVLYNLENSIPALIEIPDYLKEGILEHHKITNEGLLKDQWKPWNQLEIRCPHNDIYLEKDVSYRFISTL